MCRTGFFEATGLAQDCEGWSEATESKEDPEEEKGEEDHRAWNKNSAHERHEGQEDQKRDDDAASNAREHFHEEFREHISAVADEFRETQCFEGCVRFRGNTWCSESRKARKCHPAEKGKQENWEYNEEHGGGKARPHLEFSNDDRAASPAFWEKSTDPRDGHRAEAPPHDGCHKTHWVDEAKLPFSFEATTGFVGERRGCCDACAGFDLGNREPSVEKRKKKRQACEVKSADDKNPKGNLEHRHGKKEKAEEERGTQTHGKYGWVTMTFCTGACEVVESEPSGDAEKCDLKREKPVNHEGELESLLTVWFLKRGQSVCTARSGSSRRR